MNLELDYKGFEEDLMLKKDTSFGGLVGIQYIFRFDNGYGASVIKSIMSDGHEHDFWELAVIGFFEDTDRFELCYGTPVTSNTEGYLTDWEVRNLLKQIKELKKGLK